ncbi:MAG: hypothetical protein JWO11_1897 [Nocardioides sp.]|nr:hypothetical protein [Nocardioides sp.]
MPELVEIYDSEASYHYTVRPADMTTPQLAPDGSIEPRWGVHLWDPVRGRRMAIVAHARLETMVIQYGYDPDDLEGIVSGMLHLAYMPSADDPLSWADPTRAAVLQAMADVPDPRTPGMPDPDKREAMQARIAAVRAHHAAVDPASKEDRQGALDWRKALIVARGDVPEEDRLGVDDQATDHPLDAILQGARLDPARIAARRAQDAWMQARREHAASRRVALMGPGMYGFARATP